MEHWMAVMDVWLVGRRGGAGLTCAGWLVETPARRIARHGGFGAR